MQRENNNNGLGKNNKKEFVPSSNNTYVLVIISGPRKKQQIAVSEMRPCRNIYVCSCISQTKTKISTARTGAQTRTQAHTNKIHIDSTCPGKYMRTVLEGNSNGVVYYLRESYCELTPVN